MRRRSRTRNRKDHVLPQGYLEGFSSPLETGELSVYDIKRGRWFESGPSGVAAIKGFYDYSVETTPGSSADEAFEPYEQKFPNLRRELVQQGFSGWETHLDFLLGYAQMLRARSELFRKDSIAHTRRTQLFTLAAVPDHPNSFKLEPVTPSERRLLERNMAITCMREEIAHGASYLRNLNWYLRLTTDPNKPVITGDNAMVAGGDAHTIEQALAQNEKTIFFVPLCWQACLLGSPTKFMDAKTDHFNERALRAVQRRYFRSDCRFVYSPTRLDTQELRA